MEPKLPLDIIIHGKSRIKSIKIRKGTEKGNDIPLY
jgi:hypothetical protein